MPDLKLKVSYEELAALCKKWRVLEFALFGSALREDFDAASDVDVVVTFAPDAGWSLADVAIMAAELEELFGRPVDVVEIEAIRNPFRRREIMATREVIYAA
jgi:predicted nucleotidyltransferase